MKERLRCIRIWKHSTNISHVSHHKLRQKCAVLPIEGDACMPDKHFPWAIVNSQFGGRCQWIINHASVTGQSMIMVRPLFVVFLGYSHGMQNYRPGNRPQERSAIATCQTQACDRWCRSVQPQTNELGSDGYMTERMFAAPRCWGGHVKRGWNLRTRERPTSNDRLP